MLTLYFTIFTIITALYFFLVVWLVLGWIRSKTFVSGHVPGFVEFSIILPVRNETKHMEQCLRSISRVKYPKAKFEIIVVNDHSEDDTVSICENHITQNQSDNIHLHHLNSSQGKKAALALGIEKATGQVIITTDADCVFPENWLVTINSIYQKEKPKMIIAPVSMSADNLFENIQALDFISLIGAAVSSFSFNCPILCNGANLIFEKSAFIIVGGYNGIDHISSGDDVLLLQKFTDRFPNEIRFLKSLGATVTTCPVITLREYFNQRLRWASKLLIHQNNISKLFGFIILLMNLSIITNLILTVVNFKFVEFFLLQLGIKCIIDFLFLFLVVSFFNSRKILAWFLPTELFNIVAIPMIAITSNVFMNKWKGRKS